MKQKTLFGTLLLFVFSVLFQSCNSGIYNPALVKEIKKYNLNNFKSHFISYQPSDVETYEKGFDTNRWKLIWSDEFNYNGLPDTKKWDYDKGSGGWFNNEIQFYNNAKLENSRVENGKLIIEARNENSRYTSARLVTRQKAEWKYVKIDIKAKMPTGRGMWPAIWLYSNLVWVEIDLVETFGYNPTMAYFSIHSEDYNWRKGNQRFTFTDLEEKPPFENYYIYSVEWYPDKIILLLNGKPYTVLDKNKEPNRWVFDLNMYLILNISVGGDAGGVFGVDPSVFPQKMEVDYVRVYKCKEMMVN